jgi:hypothetical protein
VTPGPGRAARPRTTGDAGASLITLAPAYLVFVAFLLFAVQLLVHLYATSVVSSAALDGARLVATDRRGEGPVAGAGRARAESHVRRLLGRVGANATFDWSATTGDEVVLRVQVDTPHLIRTDLAGASLDHVDRTARAPVERLR